MREKRREKARRRGEKENFRVIVLPMKEKNAKGRFPLILHSNGDGVDGPLVQ